MEISKEDRISSFLIPQIETNEVLEPNDVTLNGMESWNGYYSSSLGNSSKITNSSGSTLDIERNGSRPLTDQLKISCSNFFNIQNYQILIFSCSVKANSGNNEEICALAAPSLPESLQNLSKRRARTTENFSKTRKDQLSSGKGERTRAST